MSDVELLKARDILDGLVLKGVTIASTKELNRAMEIALESICMRLSWERIGDGHAN